MRGLEALAAVVREDGRKEGLRVSPKPERDERVIAERRGHRELADPLVSVEYVHPVQVEGIGGLDERSLSDHQARSARMLDLDLDVDRLVGADAAIGDQLRYPDRWGADLVGTGAAGRRGGPRAAALSLGRGGRSNGGSAWGSSPLRVSSERAQARDSGSAATSPAAAETSPRNLRRTSGCGRGAGCCRSIADADKPQCRPGSSFEPLFDQMMYVSSAFMASESGSIFTPSFGFSIHQLIMSRSVANLFICSWNLGNS